MPTFGARSRRMLATAHPHLQLVFNEVILCWDCTILEAERSDERQLDLFRKGLSQKKTGGKHTRKPAEAVDAMPWFADPPHIRWDDVRSIYAFGGFVLGIAEKLGVRLRWGADWNSNRDFGDHTLIDGPHFEVIL